VEDETSLHSLFKTPTPDQVVIGTYLFPYRLFEPFDWKDAYSVTAVTVVGNVADQEILLTCNGGLFIRPPATLIDAAAEANLDVKIRFEVKVAESFNQLICEFCLLGLVSEPATPVHISCGVLIDNHALITAGSGGREAYVERSIAPAMELLRGDWRMHMRHPAEIAQRAFAQDRTRLLATVSSQLPTLIAQAYFLFSRRQLSEALADSWIVIEQILDSIWNSYLSSLVDRERRSRLSDPRTFSAAVRLEVLLVAGILPEDLYRFLNVARKHRNDLAHRARIDLPRATDGVAAMKAFIEFFSKTTIEPLLVSEGVNW
jgi:hypothetical protein